MEGQIYKKFTNKLSLIKITQAFLIIVIIVTIVIPTIIFSNFNHIFIMSISNWDIFLDPIGFIIPLAACTIFIVTNKIGLKYFLGIIPVSLIVG